MTRRARWISVTVGLTLAVTLVGALIYFNARLADKRVTVSIREAPAVSTPEFRNTMEVLLGNAVVEGNSMVPLLGGEAIYEAMLGGIRSATTSVTLETYEYWGDRVPRAFAEAMAERARAGVAVHVILDFSGSTEADAKLFDLMDEAGVELIRWREPSWYHISRFNHRTHRKLLIVDGRTGFAGGANIADAWIAEEPEDRYRDIHFRFEGPIVNQLQAAFLDNWILATGEILLNDDYLPLLEPRGEIALQTVVSSPEEGYERIRKLLLLAFAGAESHIRIATAFFYPDPMMEDALIRARRRGVEVDILAPGELIAKGWVRHASRNRWGNLLREGVRIHEYQPTKYHAKMFVIDDQWVSIGSANFDNRSFRINDEANVNVFDQAFARRMIEIFEEDLAATVEYDLARWEARPWAERARGGLGNLIGPQL